MTAYDPSQWSDFALAQLGASAALLGLVFVGISINLRELVGSPLLVNRALEAIVLLASVLFGATAVLIPEQGNDACAVELIALGLAVAAVVTRLQAGLGHDVVASGERGPTRFSIAVRRILGLGSTVLLVVAGILLAAEVGGGLYWWPAAIAVAYFCALVNAWVLLVEILR